MLSSSDYVAKLKSEVGLSQAAAEGLLKTLWEVTSRELSVGEEVDIPGLGEFYTEKIAGHKAEDGSMVLPTIEVGFDPDSALVKKVALAIKQDPQSFSEPSKAHSDDDEEDGEKEEKHVQTETVKEKPLARASTIGFYDLDGRTIDKEILAKVPKELAVRYRAVPVEIDDDVLTVAMINPDDFDAVQAIKRETGMMIKPALTSSDDLGNILDQYTGLQAEVEEVIETAGDFGISEAEIKAASNESVDDDPNSDAPTARIVSSLLKRAVKERASDIHVEPYEKKLVVRFRLDGMLQPRLELPKIIQSAIVARLKILASLKIDEQRLPQDGRMSMSIEGRDVDFRMSTIPVVFGEKVVMRILDKKQGMRSLEQVGLNGSGFDILIKNSERTHGMILVTGPTGSGKTTTLYAVLGRLMKPDVNILTLEDPVEYRIESINQSQVHHDIGYTFATGLRAVVRQDPDVVMLGEIRDRETAEMAVQAALTGHVVLSTLHTNDAAGAFPRLIDMGVEPFLLTSSIHTVIAQRLARILDPKQREEYHPIESELEEALSVIEEFPKHLKEELHKEGINLHKPVFYRPTAKAVKGGYIGRQGVFEVLNVTESVRELVLKRASGEVIREAALKEGMLTMVQDGMVKALRGVTSLEEVWRVTRE